MTPEGIAKLISEDPNITREISPIPGGPRKFMPTERSQDTLISNMQDALTTAIRLKREPDTDDPEIEFKMESIIQNLLSALKTLGAPVPSRKRPTGELAF